MDLTPLIPEIKPLVPSGQLESRSQRPPYTAGQILQATVSSQVAPNQFTLKMGGQEMTVESSGGLRVGQNLTIEVTALTPQLQLQIVVNNPLNQRINNSLHLLANQGAVYSQFSSLSQSALQVSQLSAGSQHILQQMRNSLDNFSSGNIQIASVIEQIATHLQSLSSMDSQAQTAGKLTAVGQLLQQIAGSPVLSPQLQGQVADMAKVLLQTRGTLDTGLAQATLPASLSNAAETQSTQLPALLQQMGELNPSLQMLLQPLMEQFGQDSGSSGNRFMQQLLTLLVRTGLEAGAPSNLQADGQQLQQILHNMGLHLERSLAEGSLRDASNTLKFALLELASLNALNESQWQQADDLVQTIQLAQLLQIRLSAESIFFMPLPFPFLHSGFLLIDTKKGGNKEEQEKSRHKRQTKDVSMHLQLEGLGNLQIDIQQENDQIALTFLTEDAERARFIGEHREELQNWLTTGQLRSAQFLIGSKEPAKLLIEKLIHGSTGMINTTI